MERPLLILLCLLGLIAPAWADSLDARGVSHTVSNALSESEPMSGAVSPGGTVALCHDANGNLIDDGEEYIYQYDAFNRLWRVYRRVSGDAGCGAAAVASRRGPLFAEFTYNALGHRTGV